MTRLPNPPPTDQVKPDPPPAPPRSGGVELPAVTSFLDLIACEMRRYAAQTDQERGISLATLCRSWADRCDQLREGLEQEGLEQ